MSGARATRGLLVAWQVAAAAGFLCAVAFVAYVARYRSSDPRILILACSPLVLWVAVCAVVWKAREAFAASPVHVVLIALAALLVGPAAVAAVVFFLLTVMTSP